METMINFKLNVYKTLCIVEIMIRQLTSIKEQVCTQFCCFLFSMRSNYQYICFVQIVVVDHADVISMQVNLQL
jgi:hypothetical protein